MGEGARARRVVAGLLSFVAVATLLVVAATVAARPLHGTLDRSFGHNGRAFSDLGDAFASSEFTSMVRQPDGRLLLAATIESGGADVVIQRRGLAGNLDLGFGSGGVVSVPGMEHLSRLEALALQGDGRILVGVREDRCAPRSTVRRLLSDGSPDPSFGDEGVSAIVPLAIDRIAVDAENRTIVAGSVPRRSCGKTGPTWDLTVARVRANGTFDSSFGDGGVIRTPIAGQPTPPSVRGLAVREDGTILVASSDPYGSSGSLLALTANGAFDSGFGNGGVVELPAGPRALLALSGGEAIVAGSTSPDCCARPGDFLLSRYMADGTFNPGFGNGGQVNLDVSAVDEATALALAPDGSVVLAGGTAGTEDCRSGECVFTPILARFTPAGALDPGFGQGGRTAIEPPGGTSAYGYSPQIAALAIPPNGQILAAGGAGRDADAFVIAREPSGQPDLSFGRAGLLDEIRTLPSRTQAIGLAIEPSGEILASAWSNTGEHGGRGILLGFKSNGRSDPKIGSGAGFVPTGAMGPVRVGGGNRVYIVERRYVARFDGRGRPDENYGSNSVARLPAGFVVGSSLTRRNGKILVVGRVAHRWGMAAFQLTTRGRPDRSFGHDGLAFAGFGVKFESEAQSVAVDTKGRIVLVGRVGIDAAALRLLPGGRPDPRFGRHGRLGPLPVSGADATDVALQADGKILIAASPEAATQPGLTSLVRLGRDGARDRSFDRDGVLHVRGKASLLSVFANGRQIILVTKRGFFGDGFGVVLHAYRANGAVDRRFGRGGVASAATSQSRVFRPTAASRQPNGSIVVVGTAGKIEGSGADVELLRFR
jgi:uncharacterized delta-60 repeat protein